MESLFRLEPEPDEGNIEYKYVLVDLIDDQFQHLCSQMKYRLDEGNGEAYYEIGITDHGFPMGIPGNMMDESLQNLSKIAHMADAEICSVNRQQIDHGTNDINELKRIHLTTTKTRLIKGDSPEQQDCDTVRHVAEVLVRYNIGHRPIPINIAVCGSVDAGKSTMVGCLCKGIKDNGRGSARLHMFNYPHEAESGRTSSIGSHILGFDAQGEVVNERISKFKEPKMSEIHQHSARICHFWDLAGHEKYLPTTIKGLMSTYPDYAFIMVGAHMGFTNMTKEHIGLCLCHNIPIIIVMSKVDMAPAPVLKKTEEDIVKLLKRPGVNKSPQIINDLADVHNVVKNVKDGKVVPIIKLSSVTGQNMDLIKTMLNTLPVRTDYINRYDDPVRYTVGHVYLVPGVGVVLSGFLKQGTIRKKDILMLGPISNKFVPVRIKDLRINDATVTECPSGFSVTLNIASQEVKDRYLINQDSLQCGMTLIDPSLTPTAGIWEFEVNLHVVQAHSTTIKVGYQPVIQMDNIRQSAKIVEIVDVVYGRQHQRECENSESTNYRVIRTGDNATVRFRFCYHQEEFAEGTRVTMREGKTRATGTVTKVYTTNESLYAPKNLSRRHR